MIKDWKKLDWDYAPRAAFAYEKVGSKCVWHMSLKDNTERKTITAPNLDTDGQQIVWLYGKGVMHHPEHNYVVEV